MGKLLVVVGLLIAVVGVLVMLGVPLGRLPGDISYRRGNTTFYFPLMTSILVQRAADAAAGVSAAITEADWRSKPTGGSRRWRSSTG